jgi:hypothetical protein
MEKRNKMKPALMEMRDAGRKLAYREFEYKKALRMEVLRERAQNTAVGVIDKIIYGEETVGLARLRRDIALTDYESSKEIVLMLKLDIRIIESQLSREWSSDT